jgi:hypothetical protein
MSEVYSCAEDVQDKGWYGLRLLTGVNKVSKTRVMS